MTQDGTYTIHGRLESAAPPELVYEVLTDYGSLARVFHNVLESRLLSVGDEKHLVQVRSRGEGGAGAGGVKEELEPSAGIVILSLHVYTA